MNIQMIAPPRLRLAPERTQNETTTRLPLATPLGDGVDAHGSAHATPFGVRAAGRVCTYNPCVIFGSMAIITPPHTLLRSSSSVANVDMFGVAHRFVCLTKISLNSLCFNYSTFRVPSSASNIIFVSSIATPLSIYPVIGKSLTFTDNKCNRNSTFPSQLQT
jgi:hypothetical protein